MMHFRKPKLQYTLIRRVLTHSLKVKVHDHHQHDHHDRWDSRSPAMCEMSRGDWETLILMLMIGCLV